MKSQPLERKFVRPSTISDYLKCPICLEVFRDAMRLFCGHTLCNNCLNDFMKEGTTCPQCRTRIDVKNIGVDLLARQIINQFEVFCTAQDCPWKGVLQNLQNHINNQCMFSGGLANSNVGKVKKNQKIVWHQTVDDQVLDKINQHTAKGSLQARILIKTDSIKQPASIKIVKDSSNTLNTEPKANKKSKKDSKKNKNAQPIKQSRTSSFDFLQSLFD